MWKRRNPAEVADRIIALVASGDLRTAGAWSDLLWHLERLPPRLREYTWQKMSLYLPPDSIAYLKTWSSSRLGGCALPRRGEGIPRTRAQGESLLAAVDGDPDRLTPRQRQAIRDLFALDDSQPVSERVRV